ncbi:MAG: peroxiredoxin-like family protein [Propionibacterium sp.]|nr:peroxiredoxin-like family protein [Propionibacterium sp.]
MTGALAQSLTQHRIERDRSMPARSLAILHAEIAGLAASGVADHALRTGSPAPDFTLPDVDGHPVHLADLLAAGPVVLTFYRGGWSPYCSAELRAWQAKLAEVTVLGASLVAVSPQTQAESRRTVETLGLTFPVLSDAGSGVSRVYRLAHTLPEGMRDIYAERGVDVPAATGDPSYTLPIPATYLIDTDATIAWSFVNADHTMRAEPDDAVAALAALIRKRTPHTRPRIQLFHPSRVAKAS